MHFFFIVLLFNFMINRRYDRGRMKFCEFASVICLGEALEESGDRVVEYLQSADKFDSCVDKLT